MFRKGDFFHLNESGTHLFQHITGSVGIIFSERKVVFEYEFKEKVEYAVYDILVSGQLFNDIPEEFLDRITTHEKNTE